MIINAATTQPKDYPVDSLCPTLRDVANDIHHIVKAPLALCCNSILAAATLTAQSFVDVEIDGRVYPVSNFYVTIADSGERKTTVDKISSTPIEEWIRNKSKNNLQSNKSKFSDPLKIVGRLTLAGLWTLLDECSPSVGIFSNEGGSILGGYSMKSENIDSFSAGLSSLWDGSVWSIVQANTGAKFLHGKRVSMHLMVQRHLRKDILGSDRLWEQGLLSRILFVEPISTIGTRLPYEAKNIYDQDSYKRYTKRLTDILDSGIIIGSDGDLITRKMSLSPEAKILWVEFHDEVEKELAPNGKFRVILNFANKLAEIALRIAGLFEFIENHGAVTISRDTLSKAINISIFYMNHLLKLIEIDHDQARRDNVLKWLLKKNKKGLSHITVQDANKNGPVRGIDDVRKIMSQLVDEKKLVLDGTDRYKINWDLL
jgi:hypothetical protein